MTVAAAVYYIGAGVFNFGEGPDNKDYKYGEQMPAGVPPEQIKKMIAGGKASLTPPANEKATSNELGALRDKVRELTTQLVTVTGERDQAADALKQAQATIKEMSAAALAPAAEAGPAGGKK